MQLGSEGAAQLKLGKHNSCHTPHLCAASRTSGCVRSCRGGGRGWWDCLGLVCVSPLPPPRDWLHVPRSQPGGSPAIGWRLGPSSAVHMRLFLSVWPPGAVFWRAAAPRCCSPPLCGPSPRFLALRQQLPLVPPPLSPCTPPAAVPTAPDHRLQGSAGHTGATRHSRLHSTPAPTSRAAAHTLPLSPPNGGLCAARLHQRGRRGRGGGGRQLPRHDDAGGDVWPRRRAAPRRAAPPPPRQPHRHALLRLVLRPQQAVRGGGGCALAAPALACAPGRFWAAQNRIGLGAPPRTACIAG